MDTTFMHIAYHYDYNEEFVSLLHLFQEEKPKMQWAPAGVSCRFLAWRVASTAQLVLSEINNSRSLPH